MTPSQDTIYFANRPDNEIVDYLFERVERYYEFLNSFPFAEKVTKSLAYYAGGTLDDGKVSWKITRGGEMGEVLFNFENHFRSIANSLLTLTTAQRPTVQVVAKNADKKSISKANVAKAVIDWNLSEAGLEDMLRSAAELAITGSEAFILVDWDHTKGDQVGIIDPSTGEPTTVSSGDIRFRLFHTFDVVRDPFAPSYEALSWKIVRSFVNKFELAARYPEVAEDIIALGPRVEDNESKPVFDIRSEDTDLIAMWEFYHEKTAAVPEGKYVKFVRGLWLEGGPLPFKKVPLHRCAPGVLQGTPFGYTQMFDLLGPQETVNGLDTAMTTNQLGRGVGNLLIPNGANLSIDQLSTSMNGITYDGEKKPEPLQWPTTPSEFFQYKKDKIAAMEVISGINSVVRGNPSENVGADASGSKLAMLNATAIQQNSGLEREYTQLIRRTCLSIVNTYRERGGEMKRMVRIVGKFNKYQVKDFVASDFDDIDDIDVDIGNPITRQISGRMALGDRLVELGLIKPENMNAYITLMQNGSIDPMIQGQQAQMARIEEENENLMDGKGQHVALISDPHWDEIAKHLELLDNPDLRQPTPENQGIVQAILAAVQQHIDLFKQMPPDMVAIRGGQRAMELWQMAMGGMMGPPAPPPGGEQPNQKPSEPPPSTQDSMAKDSMAALPQQPRLPKNPATGQTAEVRGVTDE